ncbi:MAG: hypothetical protein GY737_14535 [Desulfobacteraceae bacterium]|nr:hypothetical protein [Desulfobacteraceae bacterium]
MDDKKMIQQTAAAFEDHLTRVRDYAEDPLDDLKALATWLDIEPGEPGTFAQDLADRAIKEYGPEGDSLLDRYMDELHDHDFEALKGWIETYLHDHELVMLDVILWVAKTQAAQ